MTKRVIRNPNNDDVVVTPVSTKVVRFPKDGGLVVGSNATESNNIKLHRASSTLLQLVPGDDATAEGTQSTNSK